MSYPSNSSWANQSNEPLSNQRQDIPLGYNNWQQFGGNFQGSWQQQNAPVGSQIIPQPQGNWNNNPTQKSNSHKMNYKDDKNYSWNPQQPQHYSQQQQLQQPQQFQNQHQFTNNPKFFEGVGNTSNPTAYNPNQQMSFNTSAASDPWNWGWDEPSIVTSTSFPANNNVSNEASSNWNVTDVEEHSSDVFNPVQNYFQQSGVKKSQAVNIVPGEQFKNETTVQQNLVPVSNFVGQNYYENIEKPHLDPDKIEVLEVQAGMGNKSDAHSFSNITDVTVQDSDLDQIFDVKSEGTSSLQSGNLPTVSDFKAERLSLDSNKIPLTTEALREFCKEKCENGPSDLKSRNNAEGLTPQWSVESQMSQDTISDDISPSVQDGSHSDILVWDSNPGHQRGCERSREVNYGSANNSPRPTIQNKETNMRKPILGQQNLDTENVRAEVVKSDSNTEPDRLNQQVIQGGNLPPPLLTPRSGENPGNNPYSLGQKLQNKGQGKNVFQSQPVENFTANDYNNLVKKMDKFSVADDNLNQQMAIGNSQVGGRKTPSQGSYQSGSWYGKRGVMGEELLNQETIPDNEERPDAEEHRTSGGDSPARFSSVNSKNSMTQPSRTLQPFPSGSDNQEVAPRSDRNQYLETGRLEDQIESDLVNDNDLINESLPPGLSRLVPGEIQSDSSGNIQTNAIGASSPPPGLDRMVLGQITENVEANVSDVSSFRRNQNTPPPGLHRMVPGQLNDEQDQRTTEDNANKINTRHENIPPPGFHRMIPGESSSPESQNVIQMPMDPREQRVVTGVAKDEININPLQNSVPSSSPTPANRLANQPANPDENRLQFQSERCETIGSDNVDNYSPNSGDISGKLSKRKDIKERDRRREDLSSDEGEREPSRRQDRDPDYYSKRDRNREREDSSGERYRDEREIRKGRDRVDWDRERRKDSPGRYREDRSRRRDYREDRRRHKNYDYSDDDDDDGADTNGYYSDRERRNISRFRNDYDRGYYRRDDRARSLRPEKSPKDTNEERGTGKSRKHERYSDRERDLDRDRNRDRDRGKVRDRQTDYYRRRDDLDDYRDSQRSRPSSRNDSIQEYKQRSGRPDYDDDRDKEKDNYRGHSKRDRDMFYAQGYNYDPAYYNYYYQYYENLRRTNPAAYEWFRKYYAQSQQGTFYGSYTEDRASVHSGRSSANEENKDRYLKTDAGIAFGYPSYQSLDIDQNYPYQSHSSDTGEHETGRRLDSSLQMESVHRLTPAKFTTAHVKGSLTPRGQLIKILAHYPLDGQPATLEIHENLPCFDDFRKEFLNFPGPLVKGVTHKNNILRFCKQKIKDADSNPELFDKESYKLIWELLILLIRQNGTVVGTDIAELLMSNRSSHVSRQSNTPAANSHDANNQAIIGEEEVTNQFRDFLIYGNTKEALEWAMKHGLWGHALFLASKMDQRTYASVMTRFANGLAMNDPLQTLYQLMSGKQPAAVTCCADEKWGDWRPHLAMILSNSMARPDLDLKAVTALGDTLGARRNLHAAHFCYLMAQVEFGTYAHKSSKIVLIGSSHTLPFHQFANNEAIFATEIFEFACSLADPDFALHHLQHYKLLMAKRLTEVGLTQEAVHYVEVIANTIAKFPAQYPPYFIQEVYDLGNMLKYFDPVYNNSEGIVSDPEWLHHLLNILNDYQTGVLQHDGCGSISNLTNYSENEGVQNLPLDPSVQESNNDTQNWQNQQQMHYEQQHQQQWQQSNFGFPSTNSKSFVSVEQPSSVPSSAESTNRPYWGSTNQWGQSQGIQESSELEPSNEKEYLSGVGVEATDGNQNRSPYNYYDPNRNEHAHSLQATLPGTITLVNSKQRTISQSSEDRKQAKPKPVKKEPGKHNQSTGSWFGGIWNKLPFRPKNQMILPDDKNPSIVWDSDKNRWVNLNADEDDSGGAIPPPPKASDLARSEGIPNSSICTPSNIQSPYTPNPAPGNEMSEKLETSTPTLPPSGANKYKMTRGKSLRSNYVDVLNPGAAKSPSASVPASELFPTMNYSSQLPANYFIPAPIEGNENAPTDFLSSSNPPVPDRSADSNESFQPQQALSRWSSTSSLSREVQKYTMKRPKAQTQDSTSTNEDYYNNQWTGGTPRYPPNQTSSLPRSKGYPK